MRITQSAIRVLALSGLCSSAFGSTYLLGVSGASDDPSDLFLLNPDTGAIVRTIGSTGVNGLTGIAFNPQTKTLVATLGGGSSPTKGLFSLSLANGLATQLGAPGSLTQTVPDIALQPGTNTLFGWTENGDDLGTINQSTGVFTVLGNSGISTAGTGLAFNPDGLLFLKDENELRIMDPATGLQLGGATIPITSTDTINLQNMLTFNPEGVMFTGERDGSTTKIFAGSTQTGIVSQVGTANAALSALTFVTVDNPVLTITGKKKIKVRAKKKSVFLRGTLTSGLPIGSATVKVKGSPAQNITVGSDGKFKKKIKLKKKKITKVTIMASDVLGAPAVSRVVRIYRKKK